MTETVQNIFQRAVAAARRAFMKFESDRTETESRWNLTVKTEPDEIDGGWVAWVEELPGCVSQGDSEKEALINLGEAINAVLELKIEAALADLDPSGLQEPRTRNLRIA